MFEGDLLDLSINGALLQIDEALPEDAVHSGVLELDILAAENAERVEMRMQVRAVRFESGRVACRFAAVDVEHFERLRTLIESNLGDVELLDRELTRLDYWPGLSIAPGDRSGDA